MGFYNIKYIFKMCLKFVTALSFLLLIILCFFLILSNSNSVSATSFTYVGIDGSAFSANDSIDINNTFNNYKGNYNSYVCSLVTGNLCHMYLFNKEDTSIIANLVGNSYLFNDTSCLYKEIILNGNGNATFVTETTGVFRANFGYTNSLPWVYGNVPIYNRDNSGFWCPSGYSDFVPPALYPNADSNQLSNLTSGNFTFFIVSPGSVPDTSSIQLDFFDTSSDNNGNALVSEITLNKDSAFFEYTNIAQTEYQYILTARFLNWFKLINGKSYRAVLSYYDDNNQYQSITYNWTMSIDSAQQQVIADTTQQDINQGIQDMNSFMRDDSYSQDGIISSMPNSDSYSDPAERWFIHDFYCFAECFYF